MLLGHNAQDSVTNWILKLSQAMVRVAVTKYVQLRAHSDTLTHVPNPCLVLSNADVIYNRREFGDSNGNGFVLIQRRAHRRQFDPCVQAVLNLKTVGSSGTVTVAALL